MHELVAPVLFVTRWIRVDLFENPADWEYPWAITASVVEDEGAIEGLKRLGERVHEFMEAVAADLENSSGCESDRIPTCWIIMGSLNYNLVLVEFQKVLAQMSSMPLSMRTVNLLHDAHLQRMQGIRPPRLLPSTDFYSTLHVHHIDRTLVSMSFDDTHKTTNCIGSLIQHIRLPTELLKQRKSFLCRIQAIIASTFGPRYTAHLFGSSVTGLAFAHSDVDITVLPNDPMENITRHPISNMHLLGYFFDPEYHLHADINVGNALGLENSRLIREYVKLDCRVRDLIMLVKYWASKRDLNDPAKGGTFSSYALSLMVISYFQMNKVIPSLQMEYPNTEPRRYIIIFHAFLEANKRLVAESKIHEQPQIDPERQEAIISLPLNRIPIPRAHLTIWDVSYQSRQNFEIQSSPVTNPDYLTSMKNILHGFFDYYARLKYDEDHIISVRAGRILTKREAHFRLQQQNRRQQSDAGVLIVEDPFIFERNLTGPERMRFLKNFQSRGFRSFMMLRSRIVIQMDPLKTVPVNLRFIITRVHESHVATMKESLQVVQSNREVSNTINQSTRSIETALQSNLPHIPFKSKKTKPRLTVVDVLGNTIPSLTESIPQSFLHEMRRAFGVDNICYHVTEPNNGKLYVVPIMGRNLETVTYMAVKEVCETYDVKFGNVMAVSEALKDLRARNANVGKIPMSSNNRAMMRKDGQKSEGNSTSPKKRRGGKREEVVDEDDKNLDIRSIREDDLDWY
ncbi:hypothetical protein BDR26DRAFT_865369 [Obelidium mucronatum]|nr:hypothetical protein BDR26DRAFT_865369 [Obelidium mucronatum]